MNLKDEFKWLLMAGGMPCLMFVIGGLIGFQIYPYDVEAASKLLITSAGSGALVGIFLVVHRIIKCLRNVNE